MKILYVATVGNHIGQFHMSFISELQRAGHTVDAAFKDNSDDIKGLDLSLINKIYDVSFERTPFKFKNINAFFDLKKIINEGDYDIIHCHTPMGAVITRLAALRARKRGTKVLYTAHGFHFYKGAPKKNWLLFYPVEKFLANFTDGLILINNEDYNLAVNKKFNCKNIFKVNGVGVDISRFSPITEAEKSQLRKEYNYSQDEFIMLYPAELSFRKNQDMLFETVAVLKSRGMKIRLLLPGPQTLFEKQKKLVNSLKIDDSVDFLGYRSDIPQLLSLCDIAVSSSRQEGLPVNIMEAMAMGKAIVATNVRGNADLVEDNKGGYLIELNDSKTMAEKIIHLYNNSNFIVQMGEYNLEAVKKYSIDIVNEDMKKIYSKFSVKF